MCVKFRMIPTKTLGGVDFSKFGFKNSKSSSISIGTITDNIYMYKMSKDYDGEVSFYANCVDKPKVMPKSLWPSANGSKIINSITQQCYKSIQYFKDQE